MTVSVISQARRAPPRVGGPCLPRDADASAPSSVSGPGRSPVPWAREVSSSAAFGGLESPLMTTVKNGGTSWRGAFMLADWLVHPDLNRLTRGASLVPLEPRLMDVLTFLAGRAGEVVSKDELIEGVWKLEFISEWAVTRAIAKLRRALEDDAGAPRFIETISKRGYRLIAPVVPVGQARSALGDTARGVEGAAAVLARSPYSPGQWVRGERFYGRTAEIREVLHGYRDSLWVLGCRCIGKTSLLKELERLADGTPELGLVPLFWDLQGAETADDLGVQFAEAAAEAQARWEALGVSRPDPGEGDLFSCLAGLRRALVAKGLRLLLLCDEAEELIQLRDRSPALVRKLRRALHSQEGVRSVLAAGSRLWRLADPTEDTSPFLHGFTPPLYLGPLTEQESEMLIGQVQRGHEERPGFTEQEAIAIRGHAGGHPFLLQLLCDRLLGVGDCGVVIGEVASDPSIHRLFSIDWGLLDEDERAALRWVAGGAELADAKAVEDGGEGSAPARGLLELERLGLVRRVGGTHYEIPNHFLRRWLRLGP